MIKKLVAVLSLSGASFVADAAGVIYSNDFSTRTSVGAIPMIGGWQSACPYPDTTSALCYTPVNGDYNTYRSDILGTFFHASTGLADAGRASCDGWLTPWYSEATERLTPTCFVCGETNGFMFSTTRLTTGCNGIALLPIHNEITDGEVRLQFDACLPETWLYSGLYMYVYPVYDRYMDVTAWGKSDKSNSATPGKIMIRADGESGKTTAKTSFRYYYNDGNNGVTYSGTYSPVGAGNNYTVGDAVKYRRWVRFLVTYNFDTLKFSGQFCFLPEDSYPTFESAAISGTTRTFSSKSMIMPPSEETGGISGIAFHSWDRSRGNGSITNNVMVDNIRVSWKAPGKDSFDVVYENNFSVRGYKVASAPAAESADYTLETATETVTNVFTGYNELGHLLSHRIVPEVVDGSVGCQPVGLDGWKFLPHHERNNGYPGVINWGGNSSTDKNGAGGKMLVMGGPTDKINYNLLAQPIGTVFKTGKVYLSVDARLPYAEWLTASQSYQKLAVGLGGKGLYTADRTTVADYLIGGFGYCRDQKYLNLPYYVTGSSGSDAVRTFVADYVNPPSNCWYRLEMTADLDTRTYDFSAVPLGKVSVSVDTAATEAPICSLRGVPFATATEDIGTFYVYGYGYASDASNYNQYNQRVSFDNIRVWHRGSDDGEKKLVYQNTFDKRIRIYESGKRDLTVARHYNRADGTDNWVRRDFTGKQGLYTYAKVLRHGGGQCLAIGRTGYEGREMMLANSLGSVVRSGRLALSADVRLPVWGHGDGEVYVAVGDRQMSQTDTAESHYDSHRAAAFGFRCTGASAASRHCHRASEVFVVSSTQEGASVRIPLECTAALRPGDWYRFTVTTDPLSGTYSVRLFHLGADAPEMDSRRLEMVAQLSAIEYENELPAGEGLSSFYIRASGFSGDELGGDLVGGGTILVDNIKAELLGGTMLLVR